MTSNRRDPAPSSLLRFSFPAMGLAAVLALSGCAGTGAPGASTTTDISASDSALLDEALHEFLASAPQGTMVSADSTPWGNDIELRAGPAYHAASGRQCRQLVIEGGSQSGENQQALACEAGEGWEAQRLITEQANSANGGQ